MRTTDNFNIPCCFSEVNEKGKHITNCTNLPTKLDVENIQVRYFCEQHMIKVYEIRKKMAKRYIDEAISKYAEDLRAELSELIARLREDFTENSKDYLELLEREIRLGVLANFADKDKEKKQYYSIQRLENAILEEKLDGSNFSFTNTENGLEFYSRTCKIDPNDKSFDFFTKFQEKIININSTKPLPIGLMFFAEALGMAKLRYSNKEQLYIFDIKNSTRFLTRNEMVELCNQYGLTCVPLINFESDKSQIDPNITREGIIYRFERDDYVFKVKDIRDDFKKEKRKKNNIKSETIKDKFIKRLQGHRHTHSIKEKDSQKLIHLCLCKEKFESKESLENHTNSMSNFRVSREDFENE